MSRNMWGILAAGAAGALLGSELGNLVDPALSALGAIDTSSFADAVNGQPDFDGFDTTPSDTYADPQDASNPGINNLSPPQLNSGVTEHLNNALHSVAGGVAGHPFSANTGPLVNRNGLPILRRLNLTDPHTCSHCGEFIFGTRLKCLHCPDFDSCTKEACMALVDHRHAHGHSFMMIPQAGNYVVIRSQGMSVFCEGCKQGVPGKKFFSCLTCPDRLDYCPSCFTQGRSKPHSTHFPGHLFISVVRAGFSCDGCSKDLSDLPWFECSVCGGDNYGLCLDCYPCAMQLHPQHGFRRTFGCELSNVQPRPQATPGPPPSVYQPYPSAPSQRVSQRSSGFTSAPPHNVQPHPGQYQRPSGVTCGMCRRFTAGQWWVCTLCPNNTVCNNCIQPAYANSPAKLRKLLLLLPRTQASIITQLRLGHAPLNRHLHRIKRHAHAACDACGRAPESVRHYLLECSAYQHLRDRMLRSLGRGFDRLEPLLSTVAGIKATIQYITATGRFKDSHDLRRAQSSSLPAQRPHPVIRAALEPRLLPQPAPVPTPARAPAPI